MSTDSLTATPAVIVQTSPLANYQRKPRRSTKPSGGSCVVDGICSGRKRRRLKRSSRPTPNTRTASRRRVERKRCTWPCARSGSDRATRLSQFRTRRWQRFRRLILCGARPVLVDIEPVGFGLDPDQLESARTERTKAVMPVHLYGQAMDLAPVLAFSRAAWSASDRRLLTGARRALPGQEGGQLRRRGGVFLLSHEKPRSHRRRRRGGDKRRPARRKHWVHCANTAGARSVTSARKQGWNGRLDELQAAILRVKLRSLEADTETPPRSGRAVFRGIGKRSRSDFAS